MDSAIKPFQKNSTVNDPLKIYSIQNGQYEICLYRVMFGVRVRLIESDSSLLEPYIVDWCVGDNSNMASYLLGGLEGYVLNGGDVNKLRAYTSPPVRPIDQSPQFLFEVCSLMGSPSFHPLPPKLRYGFDKLLFFDNTEKSN